MTTTTYTANEIADIIRSQIGIGVLWSLGARDFTYLPEGGLAFYATILPFNTQGKRLRSPRIMRVVVTLNGADLYDISVSYLRDWEHTVHYEAHNVYSDQLPTLMLALDSDGDRPTR